jgi:acylphosphatase
MANKLLYKIHVTGRVQGVGFRWNAANEARNRGITGYVKNLPDGRVYMEAEGQREQLDDFVEWCKAGPVFGFVDSVESEILPPVNYPDFFIKH